MEQGKSSFVKQKWLINAITILVIVLAFGFVFQELQRNKVNIIGIILPPTLDVIIGFLFILVVAMTPFLESKVATRVSRDCGSGPGGQEIQESTRSPKKNTPRDTETTGQRRKIKEKGGFLTEMGIDRLHPEPRIDFLGSGTPKTN